MSDLGTGNMVAGYGSVRFDQAEQLFTAFSWKPVLTADQRAIRYIEVDFTLWFLVGQENQDVGMTTDLTMAALQAELNTPGLELQIVSYGSGPVQSAPGGVSTFGLPTNTRDIMWGPVPQVLTWKGHGDQAAECTWRCILRVPHCRDGANYDSGLVSWWWKSNYSYDYAGYGVVRISGEVETVRARTEERSRDMVDTADRYRERVIPPVPVGCKRDSLSWDLSPDKAKATYEVTFSELPPNPPPPGIVVAEASHSVTTEKLATTFYRGNLSASYEVAPDVQRGAAYNAFMALAEERIVKRDKKPLLFGGRPRDRVIPGHGPERFPGWFGLVPGHPMMPGVPDRRERVTSNVIYLGFQAAEPEIHGRRSASFQLEYTFRTTLKQLVEMTGLWTPVGGADWARWSATMRPNCWSVRGNARHTFDPSSSLAIDICEDDGERSLSPAGGRHLGTGGRSLTAASGRRIIDVLSDGQDTPDPRSSWIGWSSSVRLEQWDETVTLQGLPPLMDDSGTRSLRTAPEGWGDVRPMKGSNTAPVSQAPQPPGGSSRSSGPLGGTIIQQRAPSTFYVVLEGVALRAGYRIKPPALRAYGGVQVIPCNRGGGFADVMLGPYFNLPLWACRWSLRYAVAGTPLGDL